MGDVFFIFLLWLIFAGLFGWAGSAIAQHKGGEGSIGFLLGFLLGPVGLIIAALIGPTGSGQGPASAPRMALQRPKTADLQDAQYKLWLIEAYGISRNDVLGQFVCGSQTFDSVDDALQAAHAQETEKQQRREELRHQQAEARRQELEQSIEREAMQDQRFLGPLEWGMVVLALVAITFLAGQIL